MDEFTHTRRRGKRQPPSAQPARQPPQQHEHANRAQQTRQRQRHQRQHYHHRQQQRRRRANQQEQPYQYTAPRTGLTLTEAKDLKSTANRASSIDETVETVCRRLLAQKQHLDAVEKQDNKRKAARDSLRTRFEDLPKAEGDHE